VVGGWWLVSGGTVSRATSTGFEPELTDNLRRSARATTMRTRVDEGALALCHGNECRRPAHARDEPWESRFLELDDTHRRPTAGVRDPPIAFPQTITCQTAVEHMQNAPPAWCRRGECPRALVVRGRPLLGSVASSTDACTAVTRRAIASRVGGEHDAGRVDARFARSRGAPEIVLRIVTDRWQHHVSREVKRDRMRVPETRKSRHRWFSRCARRIGRSGSRPRTAMSTREHRDATPRADDFM
jgi:hypothetical protein